MGSTSMFKIEKELLNLSDGTSITIRRTPGMGDKEWSDTKRFLEANPEEARRMETFSRDAKQVRGWMQSQAITDFYNTKLQQGDQTIMGKLAALDQSPEFGPIVNEIKKGGKDTAKQHLDNEALMLKISRALGGIPEDVKPILDDIQNKSITLQEACLKGDLKAVEDYLNGTADDPAKRDIDGKDAKGVSCLGYAIGANRPAVVQALLSAKANPREIDTNGCTALHYSAAYGRKELLEYFIGTGIDVNHKNVQGQTALTLALKNKMKVTADVLRAKGAQA